MFRLSILSLLLTSMLASSMKIPRRERSIDQSSDIQTFHAHILKGILKGSEMMAAEMHNAEEEISHVSSDPEAVRINMLKSRILSMVKLVNITLRDTKSATDKFKALILEKDETFKRHVGEELDGLRTSVHNTVIALLRDQPQGGEVYQCIDIENKKSDYLISEAENDINECAEEFVDDAVAALNEVEKTAKEGLKVLRDTPESIEICHQEEDVEDEFECMDDLFDDVGSVAFPLFSQVGNLLLHAGTLVLTSQGNLAGCAGPELSSLATSITAEIVLMGKCSFELSRRR